MQGSTQVQRANAVGHSPSYLPEVNPGMQGGNTYTGVSSEPTIQDYENIFGPSARDIKTDLQRFKRHGRWHLPDVLKGPNPWLTDRIDGLITDATNSPFTTKILPYMYKEDVDGKMKWNVWSFDEGMASRVPYESAARTLTQSKRSFSGYMVRQGMAIVLEHNFMMSPKGRENFKNQLNQLIGSIQYTNDLDVHMALVLAPSYQKTMREKYFTLDKGPSQICREFCDLFGMMQKNVNALDILIEEAKAILKTWGGPMPDFLLCNSKLTFQMTMTPEKTNYFTQGADGVKRLKQGPDLSSYRGLSVIHSRAFAMEAGQHPRDILRRRVRTAEYYRILPHKDNHKREFEFYNEERDTWFSLTFQDLLRYALTGRSQENDDSDSDDGIESDLHPVYALSSRRSDVRPYGFDNGTRLHRAYHRSLAVASVDAGQEQTRSLQAPSRFQFLGVEMSGMEKNYLDDLKRLLGVLDTRLLVMFCTGPGSEESRKIRSNIGGRAWQWVYKPCAFSLGLKRVQMRNDALWNHWVKDMDATISRDPGNMPEKDIIYNFLTTFPRLNPKMQVSLYEDLRNVTLFHPFKPGQKCFPGTGGWHVAFSFYQEVFKRYGIPMELLKQKKLTTLDNTSSYNHLISTLLRDMSDLESIDDPTFQADISLQFLDSRGANGSVNHALHLVNRFRTEELLMIRCQKYVSGFSARSFLITREHLDPLLRQYRKDGSEELGIDIILNAGFNSFSDELKQKFKDLVTVLSEGILSQSLLKNTLQHDNAIRQVISAALKECKVAETSFGPEIWPLSKEGINTWPMGATTIGHILHPDFGGSVRGGGFRTACSQLLSEVERGHGFLDRKFLEKLDTLEQDLTFELAGHPFFFTKYVSDGKKAENALIGMMQVDEHESWAIFWETINDRIRGDPAQSFQDPALEMLGGRKDPLYKPFFLLPDFSKELDVIEHLDTLRGRRRDQVVTSIAERADLTSKMIDMNMIKSDYVNPSSTQPPTQPSWIPGPGPGGSKPWVVSHASEVEKHSRDQFENCEIVIIRPNIEHNMLGIIMGLGGSELGHTLWGQTELSCYDDSMHGIWGMSYKYHERAIVFNEKNLIRLWDIAYDGYNGGKDDTYVNWCDPDDPKNGLKTFCEQTVNIGKSYRGPSMMVMAFAHDKTEKDRDGNNIFDKNFRRNWPSPIVFHDIHNSERRAGPSNETLPLDYENLQVTDVEDFRVFNNKLYEEAYKQYRDMMPSFHELHKMRKTAGQSSAESETQTDSLAFQGSMRIKQDGRIVQDIQGSGHHGTDYVGVASIRAGKGIKYTGQAPTFSHMV